MSRANRINPDAPCAHCGRLIPIAERPTSRFAADNLFGPRFHGEHGGVCRTMYSMRMWQTWLGLIVVVSGISAMVMVGSGRWLGFLVVGVVGFAWAALAVRQLRVLEDTLPEACRIQHRPEASSEEEGDSEPATESEGEGEPLG